MGSIRPDEEGTLSELLSNKPTFTILMGCNGAGKSAWKRANYGELPLRFLDQDSIAGGFGDWDNPDNRSRTRVMVDEKINEYIADGLDFGMESTFSSRPGGRSNGTSGIRGLLDKRNLHRNQRPQHQHRED